MPWPTSPIIVIKNATTGCKDVRNAIATTTTPGRPEDGYMILTGESAGLTILPNFTDDSITEWEEVAAIPHEVLNKLHAAFYDMDMTEQQREAFQSLEICIF